MPTATGDQHIRFPAGGDGVLAQSADHQLAARVISTLPVDLTGVQDDIDISVALDLPPGVLVVGMKTRCWCASAWRPSNPP